ncbi:hypothetical protein GCM10022280_23520 [Sphingomonas swuensis]|uniref:Uncharacterized protein n=1 Tax=Sphingomonas swuensis TaxID=977800 RepID=A0ABP7T7K5_9SPHN
MPRSTAVVLPYSVRLGGPHPMRFGTGRRWLLGLAEKLDRLPSGLSDDARLFLGTYAAGFAAVSLYLA